MRLYDNAPKSNYEELKTFYPVWYRDVLEMDALWRVFGKQLDGIKKGVIQSIDNNFIWRADAETISEYEKFLYIKSDPSRSLEERKKLVASFFIGNGHFGAQEIKELTEMFTDGACEVRLIEGAVSVHIVLDIKATPILDDYYSTLRRKIPAHLGINTETEVSFTHGLYISTGAFEQNKTIVQPRPPSQKSAETHVYTASGVSVFEKTGIQPRPPGHKSAGTLVYAGEFIAENNRLSVQSAPPQRKNVAAVPSYIGVSIIEETHYTIQTRR